MNAIRRIYLFKPALARWALVGVVILALAACGGSYGSLQRSAAVDDEFQSIQILPEYNYYFTGAYYKPKAIIGIHRDYTLVSKLWKPVDLTADRLNGWIEQMTNFRGYALRNLGSNILNAEGQIIGIWYSPEDFTTIRMLGEKQVSIYPPTGRATFGENVKYVLP
jgi:hypothetical protein